MHMQVGDEVAIRTNFFLGNVRAGTIVSIRPYTEPHEKFDMAEIGVAIERELGSGIVHYVGARAVHPIAELDQLLVQAATFGTSPDAPTCWSDIECFGQRNAF